MLLQEDQRTMQRHEITSVHLQFGQWIGHAVRAGFHPIQPDSAWRPAVNIYEDDANYYFVVDLAGVCKGDIDLSINVDKNVMTVRGHRQSPCVPNPSGSIRVHVMEINHGRFCRSIELPGEARTHDIPDADFENGLLWITLPKKS